MIRKPLAQFCPGQTVSFTSCLVLLSWVATTAFAAPNTESTCERKHDLWLVSTRCQPIPNPSQTCQVNSIASLADEPSVFRLLPNGKMKSSSRSEFLKTLKPDTIVCFWVDGNRVDGDYSVRRGNLVHEKLANDGPPIRIVIWSWPSETVTGPVRDIKMKLSRANGDAVYLASFLSQLPHSQPVSIIGYSLGARITFGTLSLLASSRFDNYYLPIEQPACRPRVVLLAPAIPANWLDYHHPHSNALNQADRLLTLGNSRDKVLKYYPRVPGAQGIQALGVAGVSAASLGPFAPIVQQLDFRSEIDKSHDLRDYLATPQALSLVRRYAYWQPID